MGRQPPFSSVSIRRSKHGVAMQSIMVVVVVEGVCFQALHGRTAFNSHAGDWSPPTQKSPPPCNRNIPRPETKLLGSSSGGEAISLKRKKAARKGGGAEARLDSISLNCGAEGLQLGWETREGGAAAQPSQLRIRVSSRCALSTVV